MLQRNFAICFYSAAAHAGERELLVPMAPCRKAPTLQDRSTPNMQRAQRCGAKRAGGEGGARAHGARRGGARCRPRAQGARPTRVPSRALRGQVNSLVPSIQTASGCCWPINSACFDTMFNLQQYLRGVSCARQECARTLHIPGSGNHELECMPCKFCKYQHIKELPNVAYVDCKSVAGLFAERRRLSRSAGTC